MEKSKAMSRAITLADKQFIKKQAEAGQTSPQIAEALGVSVWTVRKWQQRLKKTSQ